MSEKIIEYVAKAVDGSVDAMAMLYSLTLKPSFFLASELCVDDKEAIEVAKKAYARAFCNIAKLRKPEAFELWMKQNVAVSFKEGRKFVFADADALAGENSTEFLSESNLEDDNKCVAVANAVSALKTELRTVIILHYNNGMSVQNLAKLLGVSESTANALLAKARSNILLYSGAEPANEQAGSNPVPVLTRIFQKKESFVGISEETVREIFSYAFGEYKKSLVKEAFVAPPVVEEEAPSSAESEEEEKAIPEQAEEKEPAEPDNVVSFKQKISEILSQKPEEKAEIKAEQPDDDGVDVPEFPALSDESQSAVENFSADMEREEKANNDSEEKKSGFDLSKVKDIIDKIGIKRIAIVLGALVLAIIAIFGIPKAVKNGKENKQAESVPQYKWVAGGFEDCEEIEFLNENFCSFKSASTGKYGLIGYDAKVLLQPQYDEFSNCGNGRDYSGRNSYHTIVKVGNVNHEVIYNNGQISVSEEVYKPMSIVNETLDSKKYIDRDRYFEGFAAVQNKKGKWGYVSKENDKIVIRFEYDAVNHFIDMLSNDHCRPVTGGLIAVKKDGRMGIINLENEVIVPFEYENIMPGKNGVFIANKEGIWGVILTGLSMNTFKGVNLSIDAAAVVPSGVSSTPIASYVVGEYGANVRTDAGTEFELITHLDEGEKVDAYAKKDSEGGKEWACILVKGQYGWVSMNTLEPA